MSKVYDVLIIGAGNIAARFDKPCADQVLTHAHAYVNHPGFRLRGFVDTDLPKAKTAADIWGGGAFASVAEAFAAANIDVVSVTVPDEYHYSTLKDVAQYPVQLVLAEKPLAASLKQAGEICGLYQTKNIPVVVNYSRRFVPEFQTVRDEIRGGTYGSFLTGCGVYGKGILHNGSHLIDLLRFFLGEIASWKVMRRIEDILPDDPTLAASLVMEGAGTIFLDCVDAREYTIFELDMLFSRKRIRMVNSGFMLEEYDLCANPVFAGYRNLRKAKEISTSLGRALEFTIQNVYDVLCAKAEPVCSLSDAVQAMRICLAMGEDAL